MEMRLRRGAGGDISRNIDIVAEKTVIDYLKDIGNLINTRKNMRQSFQNLPSDSQVIYYNKLKMTLRLTLHSRNLERKF